MGAVTFSIDPTFLEHLSHHLNLDVFVETGTFRGDTIRAAKPFFNHIYSIELSKHYYDEAHKHFGEDANISLIHADSASGLNMIVSKIQHHPVVFWLDAHWCVADATAGEQSQCPLLAELDAIKQLNSDSMIIIDDARLFLSTPPKPHETSNWPSFDKLVRRLLELSDDHQLCVLNDCILFFPKSIETAIKQFSTEHGVDWLDIRMRCQDTEALLIQVSKENEMLRNLGFWDHARGLVACLRRSPKRKSVPIC